MANQGRSNFLQHAWTRLISFSFNRKNSLTHCYRIGSESWLRLSELGTVERPNAAISSSRRAVSWWIKKFPWNQLTGESIYSLRWCLSLISNHVVRNSPSSSSRHCQLNNIPVYKSILWQPAMHLSVSLHILLLVTFVQLYIVLVTLLVSCYVVAV